MNNDVLAILGWILFVGMVALLLVYAWLLIDPERRRKNLGPGAIPHAYLYVAITLGTLGMALRYEPSSIMWCILILQCTFMALFVWKIWPILKRRFRGVAIEDLNRKD